ncbi:MAG: AAA family ATPase, partial [Oscillospiraceae bacterium]|nr:AAA family ATPase [Oscillospiraceae bacterium]
MSELRTRQNIDFGGELPYHLEAEQSVLGAVLVSADCLFRVMDLVRPESFYHRENGRIFEIMVQLFAAGRAVDHVTVLEQVLTERIFDNDADARMYLANLIQILPSTANVEAYAEIVREKYYIRALMIAAQDIIENARAGGEEAQILLDYAEQRIYDIRQGRETNRLHRIDSVLVDIYDRLQRLSGADRDEYLGLATGFSALDRILTGLNRTDLILLAARPSMGKTAFALNIATHVASKSKKKVVYFSLEMSNAQLVERALSGG